MAFRTNSYQQLSFTDSLGGLTSREQKALERSWAKVFAEDIFPREFDTLKSKKVPQSLEIGLFFVKFLFLLYSNI